MRWDQRDPHSQRRTKRRCGVSVRSECLQALFAGRSAARSEPRQRQRLSSNGASARPATCAKRPQRDCRSGATRRARASIRSHRGSSRGRLQPIGHGAAGPRSASRPASVTLPFIGSPSTLVTKPSTTVTHHSGELQLAPSQMKERLEDGAIHQFAQPFACAVRGLGTHSAQRPCASYAHGTISESRTRRVGAPGCRRAPIDEGEPRLDARDACADRVHGSARSARTGSRRKPSSSAFSSALSRSRLAFAD